MTRQQLRSLPVAAAALIAMTASASAQLSQNVTFRSNWNQRSNYNEVWGYTAPNGDEYALIGSDLGVSVINVVDPDNPVETGFLAGPSSSWRDIKTYLHYAYVTNETGGGLAIINLSDPENPSLELPFAGFNSAHNLYIDVPTARAYISGSDLGSGGVRILSLANPTAPVEIGSWEGSYFHDVMVQNGRLYGSAIWAGRLYVLNVANPSSVTQLGFVGNYPNAFTHNAWVTADDAYVLTTDELTGAACRMWDLSNLSNIQQTDSYLPNASTIPHNAHIEGSYAYISHYTLGVRVVDIADPFNLQEVAYFDTYPANDGGGYNGCWGAFPFFQTNPNLIAGSDRSTGLYLFEYLPPQAVDAPVATAAAEMRLAAPAPNPLRAGQAARLRLDLPAPARVDAAVFDVAGRRVATLADRRFAAGVHAVGWDGRADDGSTAPAGVYLVRARVGAETAVRKLVLTR